MIFFWLYGGGGAARKKMQHKYSIYNSFFCGNVQLSITFSENFFLIQLGRQEGKEMAFNYHNSEWPVLDELSSRKNKS